MTDDEALKFYDELKAHYGDKLVNFEHYPIQFAAQVKHFRYYKSRMENSDVKTETSTQDDDSQTS